MAKLIKDDRILRVPNMKDISVANDSVADIDLSLLPMEIIEDTNLIKLQDRDLRKGSNHRNIYSFDRKNVTISPKEKQIINLFNWRVMLSKNGDLIIMGTLDCGNAERSNPINKRLTATIVESISNHTYHLNGNLADYSNELPDYIRFKFFNGFPEDWKNVIYFWKLFVTQGSNSNFNWPKLEYMEKGQLQNVFKFKVHPCTFCGKKCNDQISIIDNNICDKTYLLSSTDLPSSSKIQNIYNISNNDVNKENLNDNQLSHLQKKTKTDNLKDDIPNKIITNLLNKDVPLHEISRLLEILGFDNKILWSEAVSNVANNTQIQIKKMINNFKRPYDVPLFKNSIDSTKNNVEQSHRTSKVVVREKQNVSTESDEINDTLLQQPNKENSKKLESNVYVDKPRIISDRILFNKEILMKQDKREEDTKIFYNPTTTCSRKFRKSMKNDDTEIHHFNNIESDVEHHNSINISESVNTHENNEDNIKYCTKGSNKRKRDNFSINSNSSTEELKQEKHWNKTEVIEHSPEVSKIITKCINTNQFDVTKKVTKNSIGKKDNQMVSLQQRQDISSAHLDIVQSPILENYYDTNVNTNANTNDNIANDELELTYLVYPTKDMKENVRELTSNEEVETDDEIFDSKYNLSKNRQILRDNDIQTECDKGLSLLGSNLLPCIETSKMDTSKNEILELKKPKLLSNWIPRVIFDSSLTNDFSLIFEGKLLNDAGHVINTKFKTYPIHERLSATLIKDTNEDIYQLVGNLHNSKHVVPKKLMRYCLYGCPLNINKFCKMWKSYKEDPEDTNKMVTKEENKITDELKFVTSSKGRKIFPPLNYWFGERVVSKDKKTVYTAGNTPKHAKDDNTLPETMEKTEKIRKSYDCRKSSKISKRKEASDASKDANFKSSPSKLLKRVEVSLSRCDLQSNNRYKVKKNNGNTVLRSNKHSKRHDKKQQLPTKEIIYSYSKDVPWEDDILSDDHAF